MTAMSKVFPLSAWAQSCGTRTVPHSTVMDRGRSALVARASLPQFAQLTGGAESPGDGVGCGDGLAVQPVAAITTDSRAAARAALRPTEISSWTEATHHTVGAPPGH